MIHNWTHTVELWCSDTETLGGSASTEAHSSLWRQTAPWLTTGQSLKKTPSHSPGRHGHASLSTAGYGHHKIRWFRGKAENWNLRRRVLPCVAPEGSWGARPRWDRRALSCHPHPSRRRGAWVECFPLSSCWSCAPVRVLSKRWCYIGGLRSLTWIWQAKCFYFYLSFIIDQFKLSCVRHLDLRPNRHLGTRVHPHKITLVLENKLKSQAAAPEMTIWTQFMNYEYTFITEMLILTFLKCSMVETWINLSRERQHLYHNSD